MQRHVSSADIGRPDALLPLRTRSPPRSGHGNRRKEGRGKSKNHQGQGGGRNTRQQSSVKTGGSMKAGEGALYQKEIERLGAQLADMEQKR